jgi:FixJ family two-component response regulator
VTQGAENRILIVEDDLGLAKEYQFSLRKLGECRVADRAEQVFFQIMDFKPHVVLLDIRLEGEQQYDPETAGLTILEKLAESRIPIIVVTGFPDAPIEERCRELGVAGFFRKPVSLRMLRSSIEAVLREWTSYYSCFVSYTDADKRFATKMYNALTKKGVKCWFAPFDMRIGDMIRPTIKAMIKNVEHVLLVLSKDSINSAWVREEVEQALRVEEERGQVILLPIRIDDAVMSTTESWANDLKRKRQIGDFSDWEKSTRFGKALERLLRDLQASH